MSMLTIILIALLVILLFRVSVSIIRALIYIGLVLLCLYLAYQGAIYALDYFNVDINQLIYDVKSSI
ncbi:hypothetical protein [Staphylococcus sp. Marseille-Q5304]|uniref:hypothetical protein n=1 Tax=Staphylococcus sp. Marseille-Q5304 TaxID=2942200 RepID=UPI002073BEB2|nr:hypothetical protein [Staphylococcus sp. Marseille-Q5304]